MENQNLKNSRTLILKSYPIIKKHKHNILKQESIPPIQNTGYIH